MTSNVFQYKLNYIFDSHDEHDRKFIDLLSKPVDPAFLPKSVDFRSKLGGVYDQLGLGSSVSHCIAYQLRFLYSKLGEQKNTSRLYNYYNGRKCGGYALNEDTGLSLRNGLNALDSYGEVDESEWDYDSDKFDEAPRDELYALGAKARKILYYSVPLELNTIKKCLKDGYIISFGLHVYSSFLSKFVAQTGIVPLPSDSENLQGAHAMTIVGYDDSKEVFICANSWGPNWGYKGVCYLPFMYVLDHCKDFWTCRLGEKSEDNTVSDFKVVQTRLVSSPNPILLSATRSFSVNVQYSVGDVVRYNGVNYECTKGHSGNRMLNPQYTPSLWKKV